MDSAQMNDRPILVTGATGRVGRAVVAELVAAGAPVRALTRQPARANLPAAVDVVAGDFTQPETLTAALRGVGAIFLVWTAPSATAPAVFERLAESQANVVLLSSPHKTPHPFFQQPNPLARTHAELERLLAATGLPLTILRPGMFASNAAAWWGSAIRAGQPVRWPYGDAETAPIDERDIAAVAALALRVQGHAGRDYVLTGPQALSQREQVSVISDELRRPVTFEELSPESFRRETAGTWPPAAVDMLLAAWGAALGHPAYVTTTVAEVTGTPARTFRQWVSDHAGTFGAPS